MRVFWLCVLLAGVGQARQLRPDANKRDVIIQPNSNATQGLAACTDKCLEKEQDRLECTHEAVFNSRMTKCVQKTCPLLTDLLAWESRYAEQCGLEARYQGAREMIIAYVLFILATLSVAGRLLSRSRWLEGPGYWWDDWTVVAIGLVQIEVAVVAVFYHIHWIGRDVTGGVVTVYDIEQILLWIYVSEPFYLIGTFGSKLVWVFLYLRMWESNTMFRKLCWITAGVLIVGLIGYPISAIVTLWPRRYYMGESAVVQQYIWNIDIVPAVMAIGITVGVVDVWVLLLPIPKLVKLTGISKQRRAAICALILLGFLVTACTIVRLTVILPVANSRNPTWDFGPFAIWSEIEGLVSTIICNLPAIASLISRKMAKRRQQTSTRSDSELQDSSWLSYSKTSTTGTGQSTDIEAGNIIDAELVENDHGRIVMQTREHEQPG